MDRLGQWWLNEHNIESLSLAQDSCWTGSEQWGHVCSVAAEKLGTVKILDLNNGIIN